MPRQRTTSLDAQRVIEVPFRLHSGVPTDARFEELPSSASPVTPTNNTCTGGPSIGWCKAFCRTSVYRSTVFHCEASEPATDRERVIRTGSVLCVRWSLGLRRRSSDCCCTDRSQPSPEWQRRGSRSEREERQRQRPTRIGKMFSAHRTGRPQDARRRAETRWRKEEH